MDIGYGRICFIKEYGVYNVVFSYVEEKVGVFVVKVVVVIVEVFVNEEFYDFELDIWCMCEICEDVWLGLSIGSIVEEVVKCNIFFI